MEMIVHRGDMLYEGKGKKMYATTIDKDLLIAEFKDDLTAFNAEKKGVESGKGALNCAISSALFELLNLFGIKTHFVKKIGDTQMLCKKVEIIPIEVVVRNIAAGSITKRLGIQEGEVFKHTLVEFYYKDDALGDPLINDEHCSLLGIIRDRNEIPTIKSLAQKINGILKSFFDKRSLNLVDFKLEFGRDGKNIVLADEISPDTCRIWDKQSNQKLDKDRFRQDIGDVKSTYEEILQRILVGPRIL